MNKAAKSRSVVSFGEVSGRFCKPKEPQAVPVKTTAVVTLVSPAIQRMNICIILYRIHQKVIHVHRRKSIFYTLRPRQSCAAMD